MDQKSCVVQNVNSIGYFPFPGFRYYYRFPMYGIGMANRNLVAMAAPMAATGMAVGGAGSAPMAPPKVRKEFPETWLWETDSDTG